MDHNLEWTTAVGEAFLDQPADVMNSIQRLRAEAIAAGNLTNTPQQQVVQEETVIRIVPAQPDVIYVPQYDPDVVYVQPYSRDFGPLLTFGTGFAVGSWLNYDCDWGRRSIYVGQWRPGWNHDRNWDRRDRGQNNNIVNVINIKSDTARQWQPSANSQRQQAQHQRSKRANARSASVNALDADHEPGGPSTPGKTRGSDLRAKHIPKPSHPDFTSQGNERIRRDLKDSNGSSKTQKRQKHVDHSQSSAPQSKNSPQSSNGQKHQQKQAQQSAPSLAKQNNPSQPSDASHGKGKSGGKKKSDKKKDKGDD
jgi:hypothetical protein